MNAGWEHPEVLLIPIVLIPIGVFTRRRRTRALFFSDLALLERDDRFAGSGADRHEWPSSFRLRLLWFPRVLRLVWLGLLLLAAAGPSLPPDPTRVPHSLAIIVDTSGSMGTIETASASGPITRLDQAKRLAELFLANRFASDGPGEPARDAVSLVTAALTPDLIAPVTDEWDLVQAELARLKVDPFDNRTNLGDAIALALASLRPGPGAPALLLLTDGAHNVPGSLSLGEAARIAEAKQVPIHVVALGSPGTSLSPAEHEADRRALRQVAALTGGRFEALDQQADLPDLAGRLARLEREVAAGTSIGHPGPRRPLASFVLCAALVVLFLDILLRATWLRVVPA